MRTILVIFLFFNLFTVRAGHIIGGEIYYDYLGNNNYQFYIEMYKECDPFNQWASYDDPLYLAVYDGNNFLVQNIPVPLPGSANVPINFANPCISSFPNVCALSATYTTIINLPPTNTGYTISYQRCCRNGNVSNIVNPADQGFTVTCKIPGVGGNAYVNSSPRFNLYPPLLLCSNDQLVFDHSATDPDGDQLVYSLVTPYAGGSSPGNVAPNPSAPPPYFPVFWAAGFSTSNPLGPGASISIDPTTGVLLASPNLTGRFAVGVQVQELRNGVVINQTIRDFVFQVFNCQITMQAILPVQTQLPGFVSFCDGLEVTFANYSYGGTNYAWDFGVPGITTDVSTAFAPTYTYPASGVYQAMLIVNPGLPCTDTAYIDINVNNEINVSFTSNDSLCTFGNSFDFVGQTDGPAGTVISWDFGPSASQPTATGLNVNNVSFTTTGFIPVTIEAEFSVCNNSYTDSIFVFPEPVAEIVVPPFVECEGLTIDFGNNSQQSITYDWDFGVPGIITDVSALETPTYTFPGPGIYTVSLISSSSPVCSDTTTETFELNEKLVVSFTSEDSLCFTGNSFNFDGTGSGPQNSVFTWTFGPDASIQSSTNLDEPAVSFETTGSVPITLTGTFDDCVESVTQTIYIYQEPKVDFTLAPGNQCMPFNAHFIDQSFAETGIIYAWDFGDGNFSTEQNPSNIYTNVGPAVVTLTITTAAGCVDTLTLERPDLIDVHPIPVAGFTVDPAYTDICHSVVNFTDLSIGADTYFYWYDDSTMFGTESNPAHMYYYDGGHNPMQIVTNEFGCKDTAYQKLYIEPFTVYAPNAFTPDGDEFNNTFVPIVFLEIQEWRLEIFNRWGQLIFESFDVDQGWDGTTRSGNIAQDGTYLWVITYVSCEPLNPEHVLTGHISLLR